MSELVKIITSDTSEYRDRPLEKFCQSASLNELLSECQALDTFWKNCENLYQRVRAQFFLYAIHRFFLPLKKGIKNNDFIPYEGYGNLLKRRFEESIEHFLAVQLQQGPSVSISSALASAYYNLAIQTLANQVRQSVRSISGNRWMFRIGHPEDHPLRVIPHLQTAQNDLFPILREATPVRMDLTHSGWSDIFFLGMDYPKGARVINISIDLSVIGNGQKNKPVPPVVAYFRIIDKPIIKLTSIDLSASTEVTTIAEVFDFAKDYLGLLKAAVIASGIVPPGMEGADQSLSKLLSKLIKPGYGIELI
ncbi:MAG TPA: UTP--glucose-1-phosphate uridylyltransferase, partial [Caldithrix sp.]|nr:UTP--glucose-1-phosphate uridylyltransferase [Caldithrix sp.]